MASAQRKQGVLQQQAGRAILNLVVVLALGLAGCRVEPPVVTPRPYETAALEGTRDASLAMTLQADAALTAAWVARLTPEYAPSPRSATAVATLALVGTPLAARNGQCPQPEGFVLHNREGFCLAAPEAWTVLNVDGGLAASLDTTPGQAIALVPDWAGTSAVCNLMVYVAPGQSGSEHLAAQHAQFDAWSDVVALSPAVEAQQIGAVAVPGFFWERSNGQAGGIFADRAGVGRVAHISFSGTGCTLDQLLPVLETLRFNIGQ